MKTYDSKRIPLTHKNHSRHIEQDGEGTKKKIYHPGNVLRKEICLLLGRREVTEAPEEAREAV